MTLGRRGFPLVIAAPSGAGKTTIARLLVNRSTDATFSVSATTRRARASEQDGRDYLFVDDARFDELLRCGELLEWAAVHGHRYGTPRRQVQEALEAGRVVVLDIDVQGARQVRAAFADAVLVFVLPPTAAELARRLARRASESATELERRLRNAQQELGAAEEFDYIVVNDDVERAVESVGSIMRGERQRRSRLANLGDTVAEMQMAIERLLKRSE